MTGKEKGLRVRIYFILSIFIFFITLILAKASYLQILKSEEYSRLADNQYRYSISLPPRRGIIYDRNYQELAVSLEMKSIYVHPALVSRKEIAVEKLSKITGLPEKDIRKRLFNKSPFVWIRRMVPAEQAELVMKSGIKGVGLIEESKRFYPHRDLASTVVGITNIDSQGIEGIELTYNQSLLGKPGLLLIARDALGRDIYPEGIRVVDSVKGYNLILTIDRIIQYFTEKALERAVKEFSALRGMAVVMDPATGEILAMANYPSFNPNQLPNVPLSSFCRKNCCVTDTFEPGSIMKVFTVAGALEEGLLRVDDQIYCENGSYQFANRVIHDVHPHGWLNVGEIIKYSSNIGASKIAQQIGKERLYYYLKLFGFGEKSGIDFVGESKGMLRPPEEWPKITLGTISFGQGISVTAIQIVSALSAIANNGLLMKPYLVREIVDDTGKVVKRFSPIIKRRVISPETARTLTLMMQMVTQEGGTGEKAALECFEVAGKTGTAQKVVPGVKGYSNKRISSFMGFVPADKPRLAILVIIDEPKGISYGGIVAAPAFKEIATQALYYLKIFPEENTFRLQEASLKKDESKSSVTETAEEISGIVESGRYPDFTGMSMRQVLRLGKRYGLEVMCKGSGRAIRQYPLPGDAICENKCLVEFQPPI